MSNPENLPENAGRKSVVGYLNGDAFHRELSRMVEDPANVNRFVRVCLNQLATAPKLAECTMTSISGCFLKLAEIGLEPGRDAYLIPRDEYVGKGKGKRKTGNVLCSVMIRWEGYIRAARRSGNILRVWGNTIREGDSYAIVEGSEFPRVEHTYRLEDERGTVIGAYACAEWADGKVQTIIRDRDYLNGCMDKSESAKYGGGPWADWYQEMCIKSMVKLLCKSLPLGPDDALDLAAGMDTGDYRIIDQDGEPLPDESPKPKGKAAKVRARVAARKAAPALPEAPGPDDLDPPSEDVETDPETGEAVPPA